MAKSWWFKQGIYEHPIPCEPTIAGLKAWLRDFGMLAGWADDTKPNDKDGTYRFVIEIEFLFKEVDPVEALLKTAKWEGPSMNRMTSLPCEKT